MKNKIFNRYQKALLFISVLLALFVCFAVYNNKIKIKFKEEGLLLEYKTSPAWAPNGEFWIFHDTIARIYHDGTVEITIENFENDYIIDTKPVITSISKEDIDKLKDIIIKSRFMLQDMEENDSCDGGFSYITVYSSNMEHTLGGLNPTQKSFVMVRTEVVKLIGEPMFKLTNKTDDALEEKYAR